MDSTYASSDSLTDTSGRSIDASENKNSSITKNPSDGNINYARFTIASGCVLGAATAVGIYERNAWWKNWRRPFHIQSDLIYGKNVDKIGHAWGGAFSSFVLTKSYRWTEMSEEGSVWVGAVGGSLFQLWVEFEDGFSQWGFDPVDATGDIVGGFYPLVQHYFPEFKNFELKASYYPRQLGKQGHIPGQIHAIVDDYEGQTFWLSVKAGKMLPDFIPKFLNISIGYSVRNLDDQSKQYGILLIAPDLDFSEIIPQSSKFFKILSEGLDYFKFPTPAIQISPRMIVFGLYY